MFAEGVAALTSVAPEAFDDDPSFQSDGSVGQDAVGGAAGAAEGLSDADAVSPATTAAGALVGLCAGCDRNTYAAPPRTTSASSARAGHAESDGETAGSS
jgi:hypothetical protein